MVGGIVLAVSEEDFLENLIFPTDRNNPTDDKTATDKKNKKASVGFFNPLEKFWRR